jgi:hypothetical protein
MIEENLKFCDIVQCKIKTIKHPKYCICIDPIQQFFLFINTDPSRRNPSGDAPIKPIREFNFLDYNSYVNTSHIERIYDIDIEWFESKDKLSKSSIEKLAKTFLNNSLVSNRSKRKFWDFLSNNLKVKLKQYQPKGLPIPKIN